MEVGRLPNDPYATGAILSRETSADGSRTTADGASEDCYASGVESCSLFSTSSSASIRLGSPLQNRTFRVRARSELSDWGDWSAHATYSTSEPRVPLKMPPPYRSENETINIAGQSSCSAVTFSWRDVSSWGMPLISR